MSKAFAATEQKFKQNIAADLQSLWDDPKRRYLHQYKSGPLTLCFGRSGHMADAVNIYITFNSPVEFPFTVFGTVEVAAGRVAIEKAIVETVAGFVREVKSKGYTFLEES